MSNYYILPNELYHHGVLGQKWGVRRYQNKDGSLTAAGLKRYRQKSVRIGSKRDSIEQHNDVENDNKRATKTFISTMVGTALSAAITATAVAAGINGILPYTSMKLAFVGGVSTLAGTAAMVGAGSSVVERKLADNRYKKAEIDPKTGFRKASKKVSAKKDAKLVNPGYSNFNDNTKNNCVLCSVAYEMRRRGYEVTAPLASTGFAGQQKFFKNEKHTDFWKTHKSVYKNLKNEEDVKNLEKKMTDWITKETIKHGDGSRGELLVKWRSMSNGHSMAYEIEDGKLVIYDAQSGQSHKFEDVVSEISNVSYARRDNLQMNPKELRRYGFK